MKYFDYTATTPVDEEILDTYIKTTKNFFANNTSLHKLGQESNYMYEKAKKTILDTIGLNTHEIVFTSNATEANNLSIFGVVNSSSRKSRIITTKIEHSSVYEVFKSLEERFEVVYIDCLPNGIIDVNMLKEQMNENTILVSVMWVNNIIGTIQPIKEVIEIVKKYPKCRLHVDAVQGLCKINNNFSFSDIDIFTFSIHKIYGPKGIGGLVFRKNMQLSKRLYGSNSQFGIKPGTIDISLIVCAAKTIKKYYATISERYQKVKEMFLYLYNNIHNEKIIINTPIKNITYTILNLSIPDINGETVVHILENNDIYVSTGSACSSKLKKPEKTIFQITNSEQLALSSIRISLSHLTTINEIDSLLDVLNNQI